MNFKGFYFITDSKLSKNGIVDDVKEAIKGGATIVQYREKEKSDEEMVKEILELKEVCKDVTFLINNRVDIAALVKADGVHLGQEDMPCGMAKELFMRDKIVGVSVRTIEEAREAQKKGADYLGVGPIFDTKTKKDAGPGRGIELIKEIKKEIDLPIVAIGGITLDNAKEILDAGADTICAMSATIGDNVQERVNEFSQLI